MSVFVITNLIMPIIKTISALLAHSGAQFSIFDIGRKITTISTPNFEQIELNQTPYPFPIQNQALIAIVFWQKSSLEPYLWFIKLPLDERSLLNQGARDHFIAIIIEALGTNLANTPTASQAEILKNNPYHFTPSQYKLAALNSIIRVNLKQKASKHYQHCQEYIAGKFDWSQWHNIAIQGITDVAARLNRTDNAINNNKSLTENFNYFPEQVLLPLCSALENQLLPIELVNVIITRYTAIDNSIAIQQHLLRALGSSCNLPAVKHFFYKQLNSDNILTDDFFIVISGRCWQILQDEQLLLLFFEKLVLNTNDVLFNSIFKDLVAVPLIRPILFACMRQPNRSEALAHAIGQLFNQARI